MAKVKLNNVSLTQRRKPSPPGGHYSRTQSSFQPVTHALLVYFRGVESRNSPSSPCFLGFVVESCTARIYRHKDEGHVDCDKKEASASKYIFVAFTRALSPHSTTKSQKQVLLLLLYKPLKPSCIPSCKASINQYTIILFNNIASPVFLSFKFSILPYWNQVCSLLSRICSF